MQQLKHVRYLGRALLIFHCGTVSTSVTTSTSRAIYLGVLVSAAQSCLKVASVLTAAESR